MGDIYLREGKGVVCFEERVSDEVETVIVANYVCAGITNCSS